MTPTSSDQERARDLVAQAMALPPAVRESVALKLLESIEDRPADADAVKTAWREEIARRIEAVRNGTMKTYTLAETMDYLQQADELELEKSP